MKFPDWLKRIIVYAAKRALIGFLHDVLNNPEVTEDIIQGGRGLGMWITDNCRAEFGKEEWEKLEPKLQDTSGTALVNVWNGWNYDDKEG